MARRIEEGKIISDLDGTLTDTETACEVVLKEVLISQYGIYPKHEAEEVILRFRGGRSWKEHLLEAGIDDPQDQEFLELTIRGELSVSLKTHGVPLMPGAYDVAKYFSDRGNPMGIGSNSPRAAIFERLDLTNPRLLPLIDTNVVVGGDEGIRKPAPDIYALAAERAKVSPDKCMVIGDLPVDMIAAAKAGIRKRVLVSPHRYDLSKNPQEYKPTLWVPNLRVLPLRSLSRLLDE